MAALPTPALVTANPRESAPAIPTENLPDAIARAYRANPHLLARRYDQRATDENLGIAMSELRPTAQVQAVGEYDKTVPGRITQATRLGSESPIITSNSVTSRFTVVQPITTGGKASADIAAARNDIRSGQAALRAAEGDILLAAITAYLDVFRDTRILAIRDTNLQALAATLAEVKARRTAGELTLTDIAQAETQLHIAQAATEAARANLAASRAAYESVIGNAPGILATPSSLPPLPPSGEAALAQAEQNSPELSQARYSEAASRARVSAARAAGNATLSIQGAAGLTGQAVPFYLRNQDQGFTGQLVLTVPLSAGGRIRSAINQASATNSGDRMRIEAARRDTAQAVIAGWSAVDATQRSEGIVRAQRESARIFYEGSLYEYRAGLRSTFDVLFAQGTLRDSDIAVAQIAHDAYLAQATLLRHIGLLDAHDLLPGTPLYDPAENLRHIERRNAVPWEPVIRTIDSADQPSPRVRATVSSVSPPPAENDQPDQAIEARND